MAELGETSDPLALVPGSVSTLAGIVWDLRGYGDSLDDAGTGLQRIDTTAGWYGEAGDAFRAVYDGQPTRWLQAGACFEAAAGALDSYASTLQWAQGQAKGAIDLWDKGEQQTRTARAAYDADVARAQHEAADQRAQGIDVRLKILPFEDPGEATRTQARSQLGDARRQLEEAGDTAETTVGTARDQAPEKPAFWSKVGDFLGDAGSVVLGGLEHAGISLVNGLASFGNALIHHPEDLLSIIGGALLMDAGIAGEAGGLVLDATGIGAVVGVPVNVVSAGAVVAGGTMMMAGAGDAINHAMNEDAVEAIGEDEPAASYESRSQTPTDRQKEHLTTKDLDAARREADGEVVARKSTGTPYNHVHEVRDAQQGLLNRILRLKRMLGDTRLSAADKAEAQRELGEASRLLDRSEEYLPR